VRFGGPASIVSIPRSVPTDELDERFDELIESLVGFYRSWFLALGVELELVRPVSGTGARGITADELAQTAGIHPPAADLWLRGAYAHRIVELASDSQPGFAEPLRFAIDPALAQILLDEESSYYLGGQFVRSVDSTLDYADLAEYFRTGRTIARRAPRYHRAIERVTVQDITLFLEEGLPRLEGVSRRLDAGARVLDVACGGGRWLLAMAERYSTSRFVGVEFEPDSVSRAEKHVADSGLGGRIEIVALDPAAMTYRDEFDLAYCQDALHELPDPAGALRAAWSALHEGGNLVVFDWCIPSRVEDYRTALGELAWGVQIDELYQGTRLMTREGFDALFAEAGLPRAQHVELEAGATLFVATK
jgi:SAM-dependent methyltransferase